MPEIGVRSCVHFLLKPLVTLERCVVRRFHLYLDLNSGIQFLGRYAKPVIGEDLIDDADILSATEKYSFRRILQEYNARNGTLKFVFSNTISMVDKTPTLDKAPFFCCQE